MKKIAVITPFLANGGAERVAITGAEWLGKYFDVTLVVMDSFHVDYPYQGKMIDMKVSLVDRNILKRLYNMGLSVARLKKLKKEHRFDLVISHGELANLPNILSGGKHTIVTVHENRFKALKDIQGKIVNRLIGYLYSFTNVSKVVTVSEGIRLSLIEVLELDRNRIQTIHNPYTIDEIKRCSKESNIFTNAIGSHDTIITAGRLTFAKGQWFLLRIFSVLKKNNPDLKLVLLGEGEMRERLRSLSEKLGLNTYSIWSDKAFSDEYDVYFMGFQTNPYQYMKNSKLFIMTSLWEGFGGTIVEAMACGVPVVSTNCMSGPGEIIRPNIEDHCKMALPDFDGYGVLMPNFRHEWVDAQPPLDNAEKIWVDILDKTLKDNVQRDRLSKKGLERADQFDREIIMQEWKELIEKVLK